MKRLLSILLILIMLLGMMPFAFADPDESENLTEEPKVEETKEEPKVEETKGEPKVEETKEVPKVEETTEEPNKELSLLKKAGPLGAPTPTDPQTTFTVTLNANGGTGSPASVETDTEGTAVLPTIGFTKEGYTFKGWADDALSTTAQYTDSITVNNDKEIFAVWNENHYTVVFDTKGGSNSKESKTYKYTDTVDLSYNGTKTGYTFEGWSEIDGGPITAKQSGFSTEDGATVTLYAVWRENSYTIKFNTKGGTDSKASKTYKYTDIVDLSYSGTKTGYTFEGWSEQNVGKVTEKNSGFSEADGAEVTLYAVWSYKIEFYVCEPGKSVPELKATKTYYYDNIEIEKLPNLKVADYFSVDGWDTNSSGKTVVYKGREIIKNLQPGEDGKIKLYAVYHATNYPVKIKFFLWSSSSNKWIQVTTAKADIGVGFTSTGQSPLKDGSRPTVTILDYDVYGNVTFYFEPYSGYNIVEIDGDRGSNGAFVTISKGKDFTGRYNIYVTSNINEATDLTLNVYFKKGGVPLTGDDFGMWVALAGMSLVGATATGITYNKKKKEN